MKKLFSTLLLAALLPSAVAWAQGETTYLTQYDRVYITLHDGTEYTIPINVSSKMQSYANAAGDYVVDVYAADGFYRFSRTELKVVKFIESEEQKSGIERITIDADPHVSKIQFNGKQIMVHDSLDGHRLFIYNLSGRLFSQEIVRSPYCLDLNTLPDGGYIVRIDHYTLKFMK